MSFESLGLAPALLRALSDHGYTTPTPIQAEAIPHALAGDDLLGGAQTGTGKTAAFSLPLLQRLSTDAVQGGRGRAPRALVLVPTRELAVQVTESLRDYGKHLRLQVAMIFGGVGMQPQVDALRRGVDILVATPGRLIDHLQQGTASLASVRILVLDEADRMLDMGFLPAMKRILAKVPSERQTLLFSATFDPAIRSLALEFMREPKQVQIAARNTVAETITHRVHPVDSGRKRDLLVDILARRHTEQAIVFGRTKHGCNRLSEQLEKAGLKAMAIHGNKSQSARQKALNAFKDGSIRILVATDVAARGLDIPDLPLVINYELPNVPEDYVHRIGRTGRNGASGEALSLVSADEAPLLKQIQRVLKAEVSIEQIEGYVPQQPLRLDAAGNGPAARVPGARPQGQRPARKPHRGHGKPSERGPQAHAGHKTSRGEVRRADGTSGRQDAGAGRDRGPRRRGGGGAGQGG